MKKLAMISILVIMIFLIGCVPGYSQYKANKAKNEAEQHLEDVQEEMEKVQAAQEQLNTRTKTTSTKTTTSDDDDEEEEEDRVIAMKDEDTGEGFAMKKLEDTSRDKGTREICDMEYPLECVKYQAVDGIVYLSLKNTGYNSKINEVTLYLNGDECDPVETYIEPGQNKDFECYVDDPDADFASGDMEIDYMIPNPDQYFTKGGELNVQME
ncbi:hypothetical protein ACFL3V_06125 [Nanoarchaeota archaeon]